MNSQDTKKSEDISNIRAQIDQIDAQIANLLVKRTQIAGQVASSKISDAKNNNEELSFGWRPKREIEILRMIRAAEPTLGRRLIYMVWRAMITRNLANQAPMGVVCVKESVAPARIGFGAAVVPEVMDSEIDAIKKVAKNKNLILTLPWPDENQTWWLEFIKPENSDIKINMGLPHIEDKTPEAICLAKVKPTQTQNDYSLVVAKGELANELGAQKLSVKDGNILYLIKGFHENLDDSKNNVHFLGAYALV